MKAHHLLLALGLTLAACEKKPEDNTAVVQEAPAVASDELQKVFNTPLAGEPKAIHKVRKSVKSGDELTLKGRVMGNLHPFVEGRSIFILGDTEKLTACSDMPGDACETPWDTCCDAPELIKEGTATIQVLDADGKVLKEKIETVNGLNKLSYVVVSGKVAEGSTEDLLLLNASAIKVTEKE